MFVDVCAFPLSVPDKNERSERDHIEEKNGLDDFHFLEIELERFSEKYHRAQRLAQSTHAKLPYKMIMASKCSQSLVESQSIFI